MRSDDVLAELAKVGVISVMSSLGWLATQWDREENITYKRYAGGSLLAAFVGAAAALFLDSLGVPIGFTISISAVIGASGRDGFDFLFGLFKERFIKK